MAHGLLSKHFMKYKFRFCLLWLIFGLAQTLLDSGPAYANGVLAVGDRPEQLAEQIERPVRVPRAFFEKPLAGSVDIDGQRIIAWESINWIENPPTAAPPTGPVYGDFRERKGCAMFVNEAGLQLCFNVVPDIASLGVNAEEIKLEGTCSGKDTVARFVLAAFKDGKLSVRFEASCGRTLQTVDLNFQTRG